MKVVGMPEPVYPERFPFAVQSRTKRERVQTRTEPHRVAAEMDPRFSVHQCISSVASYLSYTRRELAVRRGETMISNVVLIVAGIAFLGAIVLSRTPWATLRLRRPTMAVITFGMFFALFGIQWVFGSPVAVATGGGFLEGIATGSVYRHFRQTD